MKTLKSILLAATLCATVMSISAQEAQQPKYEFGVAIGDSVMIKRECVKYSTGERPSVWVWDKVHTVRQLGTKKYPDGVLLMNIYSWICDTCLIEVNGRAQEAEETAMVAQALERAAFEAAQKEGKDPQAAAEAAAEKVSPAQVAAYKAAYAAAKKEGKDPVAAAVAAAEQVAAEEAAAAAEEAAAQTVGDATEQVSAEEAAAAEEAAKKAAEEQAAAEAAAAAAAEQAKADSAKAEEYKKHNYHRFTIGVRGGASALMHQATQGHWTCGGDAVLDLQYAHYWAKDGRPVDLGIIAGLGIGYHQSGLVKDADHTEFDRTAGTSTVHYAVDVQGVKETDHQLQLEVPVMFSLIHDNGLFFNIGPKFMIPVWTPYKQTVDASNTHISAVFEETGVTVIDQTLTGVYTGQQPTEQNGIQFNINVMLTAEIGYEWTLKSGNSLGLGAYANYSVFNTFKNTPNTEGLFNLTAPTDDSVAQLDVLSATHAYADKLGYFDAGIKLAYHFNFPKKAKKAKTVEE